MAPVSASETVEYPLARGVRVRLLGAAVGALGLVVLLVTVVLAALRPPAVAVVVVAVALVAVAVAVGVLLGRRWYVVRLDDTGYRVRLVRGVGRPQARWTEVEDLTTTVAVGTECVVLRLRDGQTSTIPVNLIDGDREAFVDELQRRLDAAHGYRRL
jgi:hypothetical protein